MGDFAKEVNSSFKSEHHKAFLNIKYTSSYLSNIADAVFIKSNISSQQYNVLRILRGAKKAIKVSIVKERMIEKSPNTTRLMDKLVSKDLINRTRCEEDRRAVYVEITQNGLDLIDSINVNDDRLDLNNITTEEAFELNRILDKLR